MDQRLKGYILLVVIYEVLASCISLGVGGGSIIYGIASAAFIVLVGMAALLPTSLSRGIDTLSIFGIAIFAGATVLLSRSHQLEVGNTLLLFLNFILFTYLMSGLRGKK